MRHIVKFCLHFIPIKLMDSFLKKNLMITGLGCCSSITVAPLKGGMQ